MRVVMGSRSTPPTSTEQTPRVVDIKKESPDDEIKEYAETAMNELLGWYGYDKLDSRDTQGLNLHHFAAQRSPSDLDSSDAEGARSSSSPGRRDAGTGSSQGSPPLVSSGVEVPAGCTVCAWCQKVSNNKQLFSLKTPTGQKAFCSEVCFTQCRRANFKRNKTCDWCRHVRHTVNYVDFQDGEHQLQFCSDKCLNQYKMNIFCKETQAHLQMHPHLQDGGASGSGSGSGGGLITPELWLRDCRSDSPTSDRSLSPPPASTRVVQSPPAPPPPPPPPPPPEPAAPEHQHKEPSFSKIHLRRANRINRRGVTRVPVTATVTSASSAATPADLRTTSSPRSSGAGSVSPPKGNSHIPHIHALPPPPPGAQIPPMLHPSSHHLLPPPHPDHLPRPPFLPPGLLPPPPHLFPPDPHRLLLRHPPPPPRVSNPSSPPAPSSLQPPPLIPIPPHLQQPRPAPPRGPHLPPSRFLLPPVTVMVPYPFVIPIPIPVPIPIPLFPPKNSKISTDRVPEDPPTTTPSATMTAKTPATAAVAPSRRKDELTSETAASSPAPPTSSSPTVSETKPKISLVPSKSPSSSDRPLRKRKRLAEVNTEEEKRKFVPV